VDERGELFGLVVAGFGVAERVGAELWLDAAERGEPAQHEELAPGGTDPPH
jgi:hypothetical protein